MSKHAVMFGFCLALTACGEAPGATCTDDRECGAGRCQDGMCVGPPDGSTAPDASGRDGGAPLDAGGEACDSGALCAGRCCADGERCAYDMCVVDLGPCADHDDCRGDSYCDGDMRCTPYGVPPSVTHDPTCTRPIEVGDFTPDEQCRWEGPPSGDPYESWSSVYSTPMVVDFDFDSDRSVLAPSIVISSFGGPRGAGDGGILRVLNGRTCEEQYALTDPADRTIYASNNAVGDIDRAPDGRPEIIATSLFGYRQAGGLVAFKYYAEDSEFRRLWYGRRCDLPGEPRHMPNDWTSNNGPSIHDLDDDGVPEILYGRFVYSSEGCLLNPSAPYDNYERLGVYATVVDINNDGAPELVHHDGVYRWTGTDWMRTPDWAPADADAATRPGFVAVADLGDFPGTGADPSSFAEIVVASRGDGGGPGTVRVMTLRGDIVFGPYPLPSEPGRLAGRGGPPTIADFDGDGRREFAVAGGSRYTVFDLDCDIAEATGPGCERAPGLPRGVLWSRPSQDESSSATGSSVFDFDADGVAEVAYGDECFLRIYRGTDGDVLFSASASTGTGVQYPVIADVDGDFNSEIVFSLTPGPACPATDPIYTRGTSTYERGTGIRVLRDVLDRWAASRPIWNQHAYSVTHVNDDGSIPRTSDVVRNHSDPTLNNFRMNSQGSLSIRGAADLTVALARAAELCDAEGAVTLAAQVCNRGTNPAPEGAQIVFYEGDPDDGAPVACTAALPALLRPEQCVEVSCDWTVPDVSVARSVAVVVDPDGAVFECRDGNNRGVVPDIYCGLR